jgi:hypothetical protein
VQSTLVAGRRSVLSGTSLTGRNKVTITPIR